MSIKKIFFISNLHATRTVHCTPARVATSEQRPLPRSGATDFGELDAETISKAKDFENQAVASDQLLATTRHIEEGLDKDLDPGVSQVIQSDLVLLLPHTGVLPDQLLNAFSERDQAIRGGAERHSDQRLETTMTSGTKVGDVRRVQVGVGDRKS
jgi:hypothetical protein